MSETTDVVVVSPITKAHKSIAELMLEQLVARITQGMAVQAIKIRSYQVQESYEHSESIEIEVDKIRMRIAVITPS